jgi:hypothetical protein
MQKVEKSEKGKQTKKQQNTAKTTKKNCHGKKEDVFMCLSTQRCMILKNPKDKQKKKEATSRASRCALDNLHVGERCGKKFEGFVRRFCSQIQADLVVPMCCFSDDIKTDFRAHSSRAVEASQSLTFSNPHSSITPRSTGNFQQSATKLLRKTSHLLSKFAGKHSCQ